MTRARTGAAIACEALEALGVEVVFGLPGTQNVTLFEALRRSRLRTIAAVDEMGAGFMANGYARAGGGVGVLCTIPGPGFTYALTALAEARHDSAAVLHITGAPAAGHAFPFQALDQAAMLASVAKHVVRVARADDVAGAIGEAYGLALAGEPGPVVVELTAEASAAESGSTVSLTPPVPDQEVARRAAGRIAERLTRATRPFLLVGQGAASASGPLQALADRLQCPVATTLSGRGTLPEDHPLCLGLDMGGAGIGVLNRAIASADLVLAVGCKFSHNGTGGFRLKLDAARLVQLDSSAQSLGAEYPASLQLEADGPATLRCLVDLIAERAGAIGWSAGEIEAFRVEANAADTDQRVEPRIAGLTPATPAAFFASLGQHLPREAIVVTDSGLHQSLVRRHWRVLSARGLIAPSDFQSMGFGIPAGIGARLAAPTRPVVVITGDGGFQMAGMELLTAARERVPVTVVVFNDGQFGLIRLQQLGDYGAAHGVTLRNPDFEALAAAMGVRYAHTTSDPGRTIADMTASGEPGIVEVMVGDSPSVDALRLRSRTRESVRRVLPPGLVRWLRRRLA